jgi:tetratricopeptide (TPR) repeat protein
VLETREPGDWRILAQVGDFLLTEKKWARALEFLRPAAEVNSANPWLWKRLGYANEHLGFTQPALEAYRAALEINPNDRQAQEHLRRLGAVPLPVRVWRKLIRRGKAS